MKFFILFMLLTTNIMASLDITDLYLRKVKGIEFTYFGDNGWTKNKKNKFEFFYETDYLMDVGTNNPKLIKPNDNTDKDPLAISDWGFFIDITSSKNPLDILFFNFTSKTMMVNPEHENYYLLTFALAFPELVSYEDSYIRQSITGISINYKNYVDFSYGFILDERSDDSDYNGFYELNLPFFQNSLVRNIRDNKIERYEGLLHYDKYKLKLGFRYKNVISVRKHYYLELNPLQKEGIYINMAAVLNGEFELASLKSSIVLHSLKDIKSENKYGYATFLTSSIFLTNPQKNNIWSDDFGDDELYLGGKFEVSFQAPLLAWGGFFYLIFMGPLAVISEDSDAFEHVVEVTGQMMKASDESDKTFGILTLGTDYNNPDLLKEIPNATDHWHIYLKFRIIY